jgi:hypothetical protein
MVEPSVDVELTDMASGMGVSLRDFMAGIMTGRYERVTEADLVRNENGEPIFFRLPQSRAYTIFGKDLDRVRKDLSTIEQMGSSDHRENTPSVGGPSVPSSGEVTTRPEPETGGSVTTSTGPSTPAREETSTSTEVDTSTEKNVPKNEAPPARTDRSPQGGTVQPTTKQEGETADQPQNPKVYTPKVHTEEDTAQKRENAEVPAKSQETSTLADVGKTALAVAGVYAGATALVSLLSGGQDQNQQARGLSERQKQDIFDQGYYGYYQGMEYNPYDPATEEGRLYEQGWREGRRQAIKNPAVDTRLA